jgi:TatD DNase family protein
MIHCLKAWEWLLKILKQQPYPAPGMLIHAYGGSKEFVKLLADLGAYFSFGGSLLREGKEKVRETFRSVPRDRLLFETDAPDILPPRRFCVRELRDAEGRQINEPANLVPIITQAAALLEIPVDQLAAQSLNNARQFFGPLLGAPMHV